MQPIETLRAASRPERRLHVVSSRVGRVAMRSESARLGAGGLFHSLWRAGHVC